MAKAGSLRGARQLWCSRQLRNARTDEGVRSSGTTRRSTSDGRSRSATAHADSLSPTTTSSTSTSRSGAPSGTSGSREAGRRGDPPGEAAIGPEHCGSTAIRSGCAETSRAARSGPCCGRSTSLRGRARPARGFSLLALTSTAGGSPATATEDPRRGAGRLGVVPTATGNGSGNAVDHTAGRFCTCSRSPSGRPSPRRGTWLVFGRERSSGYDREYEQEPLFGSRWRALVPLCCARVAGWIEQFTARFRSGPEGAIRDDSRDDVKVDFVGRARHEDVADLELPRVTTPADADGIREAGRASSTRDRREAPSGCPVPRPDRGGSRREREAVRDVQGAVLLDLGAERWFVDTVRRARDRGRGLRSGGHRPAGRRDSRVSRPRAPRWSDIVLIAVGACLVAGRSSWSSPRRGRRLWRRRRPRPAREAQRWEAFRRYLTDFPRLARLRPPPSSCGSGSSSRHRVRDRRACAAGCQPPDAGGDPRGQLDLGSSHMAPTSARAPPPSVSRTCRPASARRWRRPRAAPEAVAAASRAAGAAVAEGVAVLVRRAADEEESVGAGGRSRPLQVDCDARDGD